MSSLVADTHALVWYLTNSPRLSKAARMAMRQAIAGGYPVLISTVTLVEVTYLVEKGRLDPEIRRRILETLERGESGIAAVPFDLEMAQALVRVSRDALPDMPDRMIAATALHLGLPLVTADHRMPGAGVTTLW